MTDLGLVPLLIVEHERLGRELRQQVICVCGCPPELVTNQDEALASLAARPRNLVIIGPLATGAVRLLHRLRGDGWRGHALIVSVEATAMNVNETQLLRAEHVVADGEIGRNVARFLHDVRAASAPDALTQQLELARGLAHTKGCSPRERDILELIVRQLPRKDMAAALDVQPSTVKRHLERLYDRVGLRGMAAVRAQVDAEFHRTRFR